MCGEFDETVFGVDITENKKIIEYNGEEFLMTEVSGAQLSGVENTTEEALEMLKKGTVPMKKGIYKPYKLKERE